MKDLLTISDFIDDNRLAVKVLRRSPQPEYDLHSHEFTELVIAYGGCGEHFTQHGNCIIKSGDVFVIPRRMKHGYRNIEKLNLVNVIFNSNGFDSQLLELARFPAFHNLFLLQPLFQSGGSAAISLNPDELREIMARIDKMEKEQNEKAPGYRMMITAAFMELVALLSRYYAAGDVEKNAGQLSRLTELMAAVAENSAKAWTRAEMAKIAGMSNSTITRMFNRFAGCSPGEYVIRARIKKACSMLTFLDIPVSQIAFSCGFTDSNYFCRQFRRRMKCTAGEYRKNIVRNSRIE
jgi:AraC-like DNA-binding protein